MDNYFLVFMPIALAEKGSIGHFLKVFLVFKLNLLNSNVPAGVAFVLFRNEILENNFR